MLPLNEADTCRKFIVPKLQAAAQIKNICPFGQNSLILRLCQNSLTELDNVAQQTTLPHRSNQEPLSVTWMPNSCCEPSQIRQGVAPGIQIEPSFPPFPIRGQRHAHIVLPHHGYP